MTSAHDWNERLTRLRAELGINQPKMGQLLGVAREWVSRLENGKGEFSDSIKAIIERLESDVRTHGRAIALVAADGDESGIVEERQSAYGTVAQLKHEYERITRAALQSAEHRPERLGWLVEQARIHLAPPAHWFGVDPEAARAMVREKMAAAREQERDSKPARDQEASSA